MASPGSRDGARVTARGRIGRAAKMVMVRVGGRGRPNGRFMRTHKAAGQILLAGLGPSKFLNAASAKRMLRHRTRLDLPALVGILPRRPVARMRVVPAAVLGHLLGRQPDAVACRRPVRFE
jgi:hypothetical protein